MNNENMVALKAESSERLKTELQSAKVLRDMLGASPTATHLWDQEMNTVLCNAQTLHSFGIEDASEFFERFLRFSPKLQPNGISSAEMAKRQFEKAKKEGKHVFHWMHLAPNGEPFPAEITLVKLGTMPKEDYVVGFVRDLRPEFSATRAENNYDFYFVDKLPRSVLIDEAEDLSDEWLFSIDLRTGNFQYYGKLWFDGFGGSSLITQEEFHEIGFIHKEDLPRHEAMMANALQGIPESYDIRLLTNSGQYHYHRIACKVVSNSAGTPVFVVGKAVDVHEQKVFEERSQKDLLTDCYNKISAETIIAEKLHTQNESSHVLFIVDIDNFKSINDNFGHFFGDEVLKDISSGLKSAFRDVDIVARIGGDEFIIFVENLSNMDLIRQKAEKILEVYNKTYSGEYKNYAISGSIGVALYPQDGQSYNELYQNADKALSQAKMQGKNQYVVYTSDLNVGTSRSTTKIENATRMAGSFFDYDLIAAVFNILYEKNGDSASINLALSYLCQRYNADRSYIFETLDEGKSYTNTFEFCKEGISSEIDNLQELPSELFVDFLEKAHNDIIYTNDLRETLELDKAFELMDNQGIMSFVHAQVKRDGVMNFFLGLDDCTKTRVWTEREINSLQYLGKLLSIILQGSRMRNEIDKLAVANRNSANILDNSDSIVYVSDLHNYDLLYLNHTAIQAVGNPSEALWRSKKCYELLQGKTEPCDFCTNHLLQEDSYYEWSYHNPILDKTFLLKDKLLSFDGRPARVEIATDVSKIVALEEILTERLADERFLMRCVELLHSENEPDASLQALLETVAQYFEGERSYIFELSDCGNYISNTFEYCKPGFEPYRDRLQNLPICDLEILLNKCRERGAFCLHFDDLKSQPDTLEYKLMELQNLTDIIVSAIRVEGKDITGFVGVDNAQKNRDKTSIMRTVAKFTATFLDETELITKLNKLSYFDTLTGIQNRHSYNLALKKMDTKQVDSLGVAYVDIVGLSAINDAKGVACGDLALKQLAQKLHGIFADSVFRVGGDEFVVLAENVSETQFEQNIVDLKKTLADETDFVASIGYTWNQNLHNTGSRLGHLHDNESYTRILSENLEMEIQSGKYCVYLQPQMHLASGEVRSAEALVRRLGGGGVLQAPDSFLPIYEKEGIISQIDLFVLETVCKTLKSWRDNQHKPLSSISVNCSRMTFSEKGIVEKFSAICDRYGVEHSNIVVEVTETINGIGEGLLAQIIQNFSDAGFLLSLDDFGSGYSNLTSFVMSDFDEMKIDMKIINGLHQNEKSRVLTQVSISLCKQLGHLASVAEGVETKAQHDLLCEMGCCMGQGYYYAAPMAIDTFTTQYFENTETKNTQKEC